jgi:hypothetical protein
VWLHARGGYVDDPARLLNVRPDVRLLRESPTTAMLEGDRAFGIAAPRQQSRSTRPAAPASAASPRAT